LKTFLKFSKLAAAGQKDFFDTLKMPQAMLAAFFYRKERVYSVGVRPR
jgi:hypothetical protein